MKTMLGEHKYGKVEENAASITSPTSTASSVNVATVKTTPSKPSIAKVIA